MKLETRIVLLLGLTALAVVGAGVFLITGQEQSVRPGDEPGARVTSSTESGSDQVQTAADRIIYRGDPPYLTELPILDGGLFVNHADDYLLLGGANIDQVRFNAGTQIGDSATVSYRDNAIAFLMAEQPYIEFAYQDRFYSIQILSRAYFFTMDFRELPSPSVALTRRLER